MTNLFGVFDFFLAFFGKFFPEIVFSLVIKSKRRICKEFFLPIAEEIWLNIVFNSKDIKFFFSFKQLEYEVGYSISDSLRNVAFSVLIYETIIGASIGTVGGLVSGMK